MFGFRRVHYNNILCTGRETWLIDCQRDSFTSFCHPLVGAQCSYNYLRMCVQLRACMPITISQFLKFTASPVKFQVICETSNLCTLSWQQPPINSRGHGNILSYSINCSILHNDARRDEWTTNVTHTSTHTILHAQFQPYRFYNCCVSTVNEAGRGNQSCQTIVTHEAGKLCIHIICIKI